MTATLEIRPLPGAGAREVIIDCQHGTTSATLLIPPGGAELSDREIARLALAKHYASESCRCTRGLRRRYGLGEQ